WSRRRCAPLFASARAVAVSLLAATTVGAATAMRAQAAVHAATSTVTVSYTGAEQTFTVPAGVTSLHVVAVGGSGGAGGGLGAPVTSPSPYTGGGGVGAYGAVVSADIPVSPTSDVSPVSTLYLEVGGNGSVGGPGAFNGG